MLKRRAGLRDGGVGRHVNLPLAWTDLAQLAQCRGKIQEGEWLSLVVLICLTSVVNVDYFYIMWINLEIKNISLTNKLVINMSAFLTMCHLNSHP